MTGTIIVRTDPKLKKKAQKVASDLGITLTAAINNYLKEFVEKEDISFRKKKKTFEDPYGMFKGARISEKEIRKITDSWMKTIDKISG